MLARVAPATLARLEFPLGELTKTEVRARAPRWQAWRWPTSPRARRSVLPRAGYRAFFEGAA